MSTKLYRLCYIDCSQFIKHLIAASKYSAEKEPGVYKYCIAVPTDSSDEKTDWAIEEYVACVRVIGTVSF